MTTTKLRRGLPRTQLLNAIDGKRTVAELIEVTGIPRRTLYRYLSDLMEAGKIDKSYIGKLAIYERVPSVPSVPLSVPSVPVLASNQPTVSELPDVCQNNISNIINRDIDLKDSNSLNNTLSNNLVKDKEVAHVQPALTEVLSS